MALAEKYSGHLSAYKSACEEHNDLKTFDSSLQERTNKVVNSISAQGEKGPLSIHASSMEAYGCLLNVSQDVAKYVIESEEDVWKNEDLRKLVKAYFENTTKTLEFFSTVQKYVNKAEMAKLIILTAAEQFDKESAETGVKKKYGKTLDKLNLFNSMKKDFEGDKLKTEFELVKKEQEYLLEEVSKLKQKLDDDYNQSQQRKLVSNIVFGAVFACVAVISVVTFAFGGAALLGGAVAAGTSMIAAGWAATNTALSKLDDTLKKRKEIAESVEQGLEINKEAMVTIYMSVEELITNISLIFETVDFAIKIDEDEAIVQAMHLIKTKVVEFTDKIIEAGKDVARFSKLIIEARFNVLEKIKGTR